jgi:hypothetical protein
VLYEGGMRCLKASWPHNEGYTRTTEFIADADHTKFGFDTSAIPRLSTLEGVQAYLWPGGIRGDWNWFSNTVNVKSIDFDKGIIEIGRRASMQIGKGSRFRLQGALELLGVPGEFHHDRRSGTVYYWPHGGEAGLAHVVVPRVRRIIDLCGSSAGTPARNIELRGLTLRNSDITDEYMTNAENAFYTEATTDGIIRMQNAAGIAVRACRIMNSGIHGVLIDGAVANVSIEGNHIHHVGHTGVQVNGVVARRCLNYGHRIVDNHIHDCGLLVGHGSGVQVLDSARNRIANNRIHHCSRYAVSLNSSERPQMIIDRKTVIDGELTTRANIRDFLHCRDNVVEENDMFLANTDSQDTGVMQSWGASAGNIVRRNYIHDSPMKFSFELGIYIDDASDGFLIEDNLICDVHKQDTPKPEDGCMNTVMMVKGVGSIVRNNVMAGNLLRLGTLSTRGEFSEPNKELIFTNNVMSNRTDNCYRHGIWSPDRFTLSDRNLHHHVSGTYKISWGPGAPPGVDTWEDWKQVYNRSYDQHSLIGDPMFMDAERRDYRLRPESPAYQIGFKDIDGLDRIGLTAAYPFAEPGDPLAVLFVHTVRSGTGTSHVTMRAGERLQVAAAARTAKGFVADPSRIAPRFTCTGDASIDAHGIITALRPGRAEVVVEAGDGTGQLRRALIVKIA